MMMMMMMMIMIIMETPKITQHVPESVRVFGCVEAGQPTEERKKNMIAADSNSGQKHVAFKTKFLQSASVLSLEQPVIICPISFNLILQQDNYDPHPTHESLSHLV